jgi:hypothetical protein
MPEELFDSDVLLSDLALQMDYLPIRVNEKILTLAQATIEALPK